VHAAITSTCDKTLSAKSEPSSGTKIFLYIPTLLCLFP
jgi:hypothetical protein